GLHLSECAIGASGATGTTRPLGIGGRGTVADQALSAFRRALRRLFRRAALPGLSRCLRAARAISEQAVRYTCAACSLSPASTSLRNFLIWVRMAERWETLRSRRTAFCRARLRAWGELAKSKTPGYNVKLWFSEPRESARNRPQSQ